MTGGTYFRKPLNHYTSISKIVLHYIQKYHTIQIITLSRCVYPPLVLRSVVGCNLAPMTDEFPLCEAPYSVGDIIELNKYQMVLLLYFPVAILNDQSLRTSSYEHV